MRFDLTNLPNNIDTLRGMIVTQAANFAAELGAREAELAAAKAGLLAKTLEIEKLKLRGLSCGFPRFESLCAPLTTPLSCA
jgi:hypothetical protein